MTKKLSFYEEKPFEKMANDHVIAENISLRNEIAELQMQLQEKGQTIKNKYMQVHVGIRLVMSIYHFTYSFTSCFLICYNRSKKKAWPENFQGGNLQRNSVLSLRLVATFIFSEQL